MSPTDGVRFREYEESRDRGQAAELLSLVYRSGEPMPEDRPLVDGEGHAYLAERDGRVLAYFEVLPMRATLPRHPVPCAGIAAVAVRPEARSGGLGRAMMRWALAPLRERGYAMASLYAFRESFYRPVGYEVVGRRFQIVCPHARLPHVSSELAVHAADEEGWQRAAPVYEVFARRYSGMNLRSPEQWKTVTRGTGGKTRLFLIGDPAEAYAVVHLQGAFWEQQRVSEVAWSSKAGYDGLLAFFRSLAANKSHLAWYEPGDSPFLARSLDQGVEVSLERWMMSRALDVPTVLRALKPLGEGTLGIDVLDPAIPEHAGPWTITWSSEGIEAKQGGDAEATLPVGAFTQAAHGEPCAEELLEAGTAQCRPEARPRLAQLFPRGRAYCMDFF